MQPLHVATAIIIATASLLILNVSATEEQTYVNTPEGMAQDFLMAHNEVRAKYNEPMLTWDPKLAEFAYNWALKTDSLGKCEQRYHSGGPYGENLFWGWSWNDHYGPRDAVMMWAEEKNYFDVNSVQCAPGKMCGHFTQVVWRNSQRVGCSRIKCATGGVLMNCNYDPPGNWIDAKLGGLMNPFVGPSNVPAPPNQPPPVPVQVTPPVPTQVAPRRGGGRRGRGRGRGRRVHPGHHI